MGKRNGDNTSSSSKKKAGRRDFNMKSSRIHVNHEFYYHFLVVRDEMLPVLAVKVSFTQFKEIIRNALSDRFKRCWLTFKPFPDWGLIQISTPYPRPAGLKKPICPILWTPAVTLGAKGFSFCFVFVGKPLNQNKTFSTQGLPAVRWLCQSKSSKKKRKRLIADYANPLIQHREVT